MENSIIRTENKIKVYIIILNYKNWQDTIECIVSVLKSTYTNYQILAVDNSPNTESITNLTEWAKDNNISHSFLVEQEDVKHYILSSSKIIFFKAKANLGFAAGNNVAIRYATYINNYSYLWLLNNDTIIQEDGLNELVSTAVKDLSQGRSIGIWGSKLIYYHSPELIQAIGGKVNWKTLTTSHIGENQLAEQYGNEALLEQDYVVGASMFVSREFIEKVGLLNEAYFLYFEELDWATRAKRIGLGLGYVPSSKIYHKEGSTIGSSGAGKKKSALADYHGQRSKIIFFKNYFPERKFQLYLILAGSVILRIARFQFGRAWKIAKLAFTTT